MNRLLRYGALLISVLATVPVLPCAALAGKLSVNGNFVQGGLAIGRTDAGTVIRLDSQLIRVNRDGHFVFGFGRDSPSTMMLRAIFTDGSEQTRHLTIEQRTYRIQRIDGLPSAMVTPSKKQIERILAESRQIRAARAVFSSEPLFLDGFAWPLTGIVSGRYGSQRILNGEPRRPHLGIDIAAALGTPVKASADGTVTLAERDLYFTGGTVIIDHGLGVSTVYSHLLDLEVAISQKVRKDRSLGQLARRDGLRDPILTGG